MTTIAYRQGVIAADSYVSAGELMLDQTQKLHTLYDGSVVGFSGDLSESQVTLEMLQSHEGPWEKLDFKGERDPHHFILVTPSRRVLTFHYKNRRMLSQRLSYTALGTGKELALGAMAHGASAIEAVRAAIKHDINSGGRIRSVRVF